MTAKGNATGATRKGTFGSRREGARVIFTGRLRLADGTKSARFDLPLEMNEPKARAHLGKLQASEDVTQEVYRATLDRKRKEGALASPETVDEWFRRFLPTKECGASHRRISGDVWSKYVSPVIGPKRIASLTRDDIEDVRDGIDRALDAGKIRHRTAQNAWGGLTSALKAAYASRERSLRVLSERIYADILPPKKGRTRARPWLYPREWVELSQHEDFGAIPIVWRRIYAIALYTGLRPGELRALTWADVDLVARTIDVSKAIDAETGNLKATKSAAGHRVIPILPELMPLLDAMAVDSSRADLVLPELESAMEDAAKALRGHLASAGVTRARLTADTESEEPVDFRSLRDSHATWCALARVPDKVIQRRMGHATASTTDGYIKAAEALDPTEIGHPFPPLGVAFFWPTTRSTSAGGEPISGVSGPVNGRYLADRPSNPEKASLQILPAQPSFQPGNNPSGAVVQNPAQEPGWSPFGEVELDGAGRPVVQGSSGREDNS